MTKLPVLYVSCDTEALKTPKSQSSLRRLIRGRDANRVVFITSDAALNTLEIHHQAGERMFACELQTLLNGEGFDTAIRPGQSADFAALAEVLIPGTSFEVTELRLNLGMACTDYRRVGQCLEACRDHGVLIICFDQISAREVNSVRHQPHDAYIRNLIGQWEEELRWARAFSKSEMSQDESNNLDEPLSDPTMCILNTAFSLGGMRAPQRVFGSSLNEGGQSLAGYGWMQ